MKALIEAAQKLTLAAGLFFTGTVLRAESTIAQPIPGSASTMGDGAKGVVLIAVRWDRRWNCGGFENAQLRFIGFDKLPSTKSSDEARSDIVLDDAPRLLTKPMFDHYAFLVEPGEYGVSRIDIKVASSVRDIRIATAPRSKLLKDGQPLGGSFTVGTGETVFIGLFYLDCYQEPTLWRYYPDGREEFNRYLETAKKTFPALDTEKVVFRLFRTTVFGQDYSLQSVPSPRR